MLLSGCITRTQTKLVTQYHTEFMKPPAAFLLPCAQPFYRPPLTYGEAVIRDPLWLSAFSQCAFKVDALRVCYLSSDTPEAFEACLTRFGAANSIQSGESSRVNRLAAPPFVK
ncbi:MAG: hypothetical protein CENE_03811 [Candidatus Celerinatantimonas neptuna]|nr:MAG: hypothetical protein CENE_03811 [Candidatus Celerinatantimonas neptuna]